MRRGGRASPRSTRTLDTLDRLETHEGFFFNYYDTTSLERTSNFISFVDSSWLTAGLMVARAAFPALAAPHRPLIEPHGLPLLLRPSSALHVARLLRPPPRALALPLRRASTPRRASGALLAIGKGDVPERALVPHGRAPIRPTAAWQNEPPIGARARRRSAARTVRGGYYEWEGVRYVPSWGGSMFEALDADARARRGSASRRRASAPTTSRTRPSSAATRSRRSATRSGACRRAPCRRGDGYREYGVRVLGIARLRRRAS